MRRWDIIASFDGLFIFVYDRINRQAHRITSKSSEIFGSKSSLACLMAEQLQKQLDVYLKSLSNAKNIVDAWEKRKLEIKREMDEFQLQP